MTDKRTSLTESELEQLKGIYSEKFLSGLSESSKVFIYDECLNYGIIKPQKFPSFVDFNKSIMGNAAETVNYGLPKFGGEK